ncbi:MAG TPA: hypothetical protein VMV69_03635 [Pirellulales bacterium]|nr:hypothetical protein [Pirellulales bacterium]
MTLERFNRRETLLEQFDAQRRLFDQAPAVRDFNSIRARAASLLTSENVGGRRPSPGQAGSSGCKVPPDGLEPSTL